MLVNRWTDRTYRHFVTIGLACITTSMAHAQWSVADSSGNMAIHAVSNYGPEGFLCISGELHTSTNAGADWNTTIPVLGSLPLFGIWNASHFPTTTEGLMAGAFDFNNQYAIVRSVDGGASWQMVHFSNAGVWPRRYTAMHFPTAVVGYAVGSNGRISKTTNSGDNWFDLALPVGPDINSVYFATATNGAIAGDGFVAYTSSGGTAWSTTAVQGNHALAGAGQVVVAAGPGLLHVSTNGGATWAAREAPFASVSDLHVFNEQEFVVVDETQYKLFITDSGGDAWETAVLPTDAYIAAVQFLTPEVGALVGGTGQHSLIMTTSTGAGPGEPYVDITSTTAQSCGSTILSLEAQGVDPGWTLTWLRDGTEVGAGPSIDLEYTVSNNAGIELLVSNGVRTSSTPWNDDVAVIQPFTVDAGEQTFLCADGTGQLSVNAPIGASVLWSPVTGLSDPTSTDPNVSGLTGSTDYTVTVSVGPCTASDAVTVDVAPEIQPIVWNDLLTEGYTQGLFQFLDEHNGFVGEANNTMWRTHDGGLTWDSLSVTGEAEGVQNRLCMTDPFNGYFNDEYQLFHTTDGWETYDTIPNETTILGNYRKEMFARNRDTLLLMCSRFPGPNYRLLRSTDAGYSWTQVYEGGRVIHDIQFLPNNGVLIAGGEGLFTSYMARSWDGGSTWSEVGLPPGSPAVYDLELTEDGTLYAVAYDEVWRSTDLGTTWAFNFTGPGPLSQGFGYIHFQGPDSGLVSINGTLFRTVTGGDCWQGAGPNIQPYIGNIGEVDGTWFMQASEEPWSFKTLYRSDPPSPGLRFVLANDTICSGTAQHAVNNSIGFTSFGWWLDGSLLTTDEQPEIPVLGPGDHELELRGTNGNGTQVLSRFFHVESFTATAELSFSEVPCWANDTVRIAANSTNPVLGYAWYRLNGPLVVPEPGGGAEHAVVASGNSTTYYAAPISRSGCLGSLSAPITVVATDAIPGMIIPQGPSAVCTWGQPTSTTYFAMPQGTPTDLTGFAWSMTPTSSGTIAFAGDSCVVNWDPLYNGSASLKVSAIDACGTGPVATRVVNVDRGVRVLTQPQDLIVEVGSPFSLSVVLDAAVTGSRRWYQDGEIIATSVNSISFPAATFDMAGDYHWTGQISSVCGVLSSDTITVTVTGPTGFSTALGKNNLSVYPNPFSGLISVVLPALEHTAKLTALDATGRMIMERSLPIGSSYTIELDLSGTRSGPIILWLKGQDINAHAAVVKLP